MGKGVIPANAGIEKCLIKLDASRLHQNDGLPQTLIGDS